MLKLDEMLEHQFGDWKAPPKYYPEALPVFATLHGRVCVDSRNPHKLNVYIHPILRDYVKKYLSINKYKHRDVASGLIQIQDFGFSEPLEMVHAGLVSIAANFRLVRLNPHADPDILDLFRVEESDPRPHYLTCMGNCFDLLDSQQSNLLNELDEKATLLEINSGMVENQHRVLKEHIERMLLAVRLN